MHKDTYKRRHYPLVNITMPVWNRYDETLCAIDSVARHTSSAYTLTVVDNGSDDVLRKELLKLYESKIIHNLYFLDKNYGVSCACNTGWNLHPAPFCMKLDNDMEILSPTWLQDIFCMWEKNRYATLFGPVWQCDVAMGKVVTDFGTYWVTPVSFSGAALLVGAKTIESIGYFSEDYGLYGEEDADYCLRAHHAGIRKYTFECSPLIRHRGIDDAEYLARHLDKRAVHEGNVGTAERGGLFALNIYLYKTGLRALKVPLKYAVATVRGHAVELRENQQHASLQEVLRACLAIYNDGSLEEAQKREGMAKLLGSGLVC